MENHYISIDNREKITVSQVADVDAFDEDTLWANLKEGGLEITGRNLNIEKLDGGRTCGYGKYMLGDIYR